MPDTEPDLPLDADVLARFSTRSFSGHPGLTIALTVIVGLSALQVALLAGLHPLLFTAVLLGAMLFVFTRRAGHAYYVLTAEGIHQEVQPFLQAFGGRAPRSRFLPLAAVRAHRADSNFTREGDPVQRLFLDLDVAPGRLSLNDEFNPDQFQAFRDALIALLEARAEDQG